MTADSQAAQALKLLDGLTQHAPDSMATGALNPKHISDCKGVVFQHYIKAGVGLGFQHGSGFMVLKKDGKWTAPFFIKSNSMSFGITIGFNRVDSLMVLHSDKAVEYAKRGKFTVGLDLNLAMIGDIFSDGGCEFTNQKDLDMVAFAHGNGIIADLSLHGAELHHDKELNASVYGADATDEAILAGEAPSPPAFGELFARLEELAAQGGVSGLAWQPHATTVAEKQLL